MTILVDARGMRCPWPTIRLARAAREAGAGACVRILADDPLAASEIAGLVREKGWHMEKITTEMGEAFEIKLCASTHCLPE